MAIDLAYIYKCVNVTKDINTDEEYSCLRFQFKTSNEKRVIEDTIHIVLQNKVFFY